jgi:thiol-disulfide isomerase/thioredoxin
VAAVVVAGYVVGSGNDRQTLSDSSATGPAQAVQPAQPGKSEMVVKLASWSGGDSIALTAPGKPTVLLAMAGWCASCIQPARDLTVISNEFGASVRVLAFSVDPGESERTLARFREAAGTPSYDWGFDTTGSVARAFDLRYLDTIVVLDAEGREVFKGVRPSNDKLREVLQPLVARSQ